MKLEGDVVCQTTFRVQGDRLAISQHHRESASERAGVAKAMEETFNIFLNIAKACTLQVCVHCFLERTISQVLLILVWLQDGILLPFCGY